MVTLSESSFATVWSAVSGRVLLRFSIPWSHRVVLPLGTGDRFVTGVSSVSGVVSEPTVLWDANTGAVLRRYFHLGEQAGS